MGSARVATEPMSHAEVAAFFGLGVALEAAWLPDDELRRAVAEGRVTQAISWSSMGGAETYWSLVDADTNLATLRDSAIVVPPGQEAQPTPYEDRYDDRDVVGVLWDPFRAEQLRRVVRAVPDAQRAVLLTQCAHLLAALEARWCEGRGQAWRGALIEQLRAEDCTDPDGLRALLSRFGRRSVRHLVRGLRARFFTGDLEAAIEAVGESAARFDAPLMWRHALRFELLRIAARLMIDRAWIPVELGPTMQVPPTFVCQPPLVDMPPTPADAELELRVRQALRALAIRLAEQDAAHAGGVHGAPGFEVVALERDGASLRARGVVDNLIWHMAQSGSDWFEHNVYLATLAFSDGAIVNETFERRGRYDVSERDEPTYDRKGTCLRLARRP